MKASLRERERERERDTHVDLFQLSVVVVVVDYVEVEQLISNTIGVNVMR